MAMKQIDDEDYICKNYRRPYCPHRCSFFDCPEFEPAEYFKNSLPIYIKELEDK